MFGALVIKVLKSKKLKFEAGRLSSGFLDFYSAPSSSSFFGFGASFFGASFFFSSFFGAVVPVATEKTGNIYGHKTSLPKTEVNFS